MTPIAIFNDRVVAKVSVEETHVVRIQKFEVQGRVVGRPQTTLNEATLGNVTLIYGSAQTLPLSNLNPKAKYQVRLQANRL